MNPQVIKALLKKDTALFMSNRFYMLITVVGLVFYIGIYFILPAQTDEKLSLAIYAPVVPPSFTQLTEHEGTDIELFSSEEALKQAVLDGNYQVAIVLPADIIETWLAGDKPDITVYYSSTAPSEINAAVVALVKELSYAQTGQALNFETTEEILGPDMLGNQIALRDRIRPLLVVFILLVEILTLASLIAVEIEQGTARALLVTPLRISELFLAKGLLGIVLALGQAVLFMALVGGFSHEPFIILAALFVGSLMAVGVGFLLAAATRDVTAVTGWGMLILILLAVPGFGVVIPGLVSDWAKVIPSFYLTDTVSRVANYGAGWGDIGLNLAILAGFTTVVFIAGMMTLRRRYR
ncbi:MAG: ABC transporter permease [Dehalococcoidales bacterium]|nr:ABC transporter permease [Dehalococcoidales bacterium]